MASGMQEQACSGVGGGHEGGWVWRLRQAMIVRLSTEGGSNPSTEQAAAPATAAAPEAAPATAQQQQPRQQQQRRQWQRPQPSGSSPAAAAPACLRHQEEQLAAVQVAPMAQQRRLRARGRPMVGRKRVGRGVAKCGVHLLPRMPAAAPGAATAACHRRCRHNCFCRRRCSPALWTRVSWRRRKSRSSTAQHPRARPARVWCQGVGGGSE